MGEGCSYDSVEIVLRRTREGGTRPPKETWWKAEMEKAIPARKWHSVDGKRRGMGRIG